MVRREKLDESRAGELLETVYTCVRYSRLYRDRNYDSMDDSVQEIAMKVWIHRRRYDPSKGTLSAWVGRITERHLIDKNRRRRAEFERKERYSNEPDSRKTKGVEEDEPDPAFKENRLWRFISELPESLREVAMLRARGMSYGDIAQATGKPLGTIKSKISRIRENLKERVK